MITTNAKQFHTGARGQKFATQARRGTPATRADFEALKRSLAPDVLRVRVEEAMRPVRVAVEAVRLRQAMDERDADGLTVHAGDEWAGYSLNAAIDGKATTNAKRPAPAGDEWDSYSLNDAIDRERQR